MTAAVESQAASRPWVLALGVVRSGLVSSGLVSWWGGRELADARTGNERMLAGWVQRGAGERVDREGRSNAEGRGGGGTAQARLGRMRQPSVWTARARACRAGQQSRAAQGGGGGRGARQSAHGQTDAGGGLEYRADKPGTARVVYGTATHAASPEN